MKNHVEFSRQLTSHEVDFLADSIKDRYGNEDTAKVEVDGDFIYFAITKYNISGMVSSHHDKTIIESNNFFTLYDVINIIVYNFDM